MTVRDLGRAIGGAVLERLGRAASRFHEETPIPVDVLESDDEYLVIFDAPGATASEIDVGYADGTVSVRIDRFREVREGYTLRFPGRGLQLDRSADLPGGAEVEPESARAELKDNGTLYVFLSKTNTGDAHEIEIGDNAESSEGKTRPTDDEDESTGGADESPADQDESAAK